MGLDNYPRAYPCKTRGTAVMVEDRIDCDATQKAGGCPWSEALGEEPGRVYGMFGTDCWYRGKTGMWMLEILETNGYICPLDFYGSDEDGLTAEQCLELSKWMADHGEAFSESIWHGEHVENDEIRDTIKMYHYAVKWLKWAGENCDGIEAWW